MHDNSALTIARIDRYLAEWIVPAVVRDRHALDVTSWQVPDEPVPFAQAREAFDGGRFAPHPVGTPWGRPWSTVWFHLTGTVPQDWPLDGTRAELDIDLGFIHTQPGFQAEGAAWSPDGVLVKGVSPRNAWVPLPQRGGHAVEMFIEGAANPDVPGDAWSTPTPMGDKATAPPEELYRLRAVDVVLVDTAVEDLVADVRALRGLIGTLPATSARRAQILAALEDMCDVVDPDDVAGTATAGREALAEVLAVPASSTAHRAAAVGHAHIDSAWLWPVRETVRKVSRTVANVLALMDSDPDVTFAFSSAQQYAWIKEYYPELYQRLAERVREGRIEPVGGMWVESDTNMVGSEALVRQFLEGKSFFATEFGAEPTQVWLPDSFGYTGSFPQVARLAGCTDFLTQKLSWNDTNRIPHHSFWWEGIDGSRVYTHFPPVDTYNSVLNAEELERASSQYADKARSSISLVPYGYGDGGGGPTREMVAQGHRVESLEGSARVEFTTAEAFFEASRQEYAAIAPTWVGELYLEYHRGTYTTQARTKRGNRRSEHLLREAELWSATAAVRAGADYPYEELQRLWRETLLLQFHDILPGTSIAWVHREAEASYAAIATEAEALIARALEAIAEQDGAAAGSGGQLVANASPFAQKGVAPGAIGAAEVASPARVERDGEDLLLVNDAVRVRVDRRGLVTSAVLVATGREGLAAPGNLLQLARDIPNTWEAWDIEEHYRRTISDVLDGEVEETTDENGAPAIRVTRTVGRSRVVQVLSLAPGTDPTLHLRTDVDWHEQQKLLKLGFTLDVHTDHARSEMQFGHITRPTHVNTSWDAARFETVAHRWVHVAEPGFGVAFSNDGTYGHDITRVRVGGDVTAGREDGAADDGRVATQVRWSLLRAPLFPDPVADQGEHTLRHAVTFGAQVSDAVEHGYALNLPLREVWPGDASGEAASGGAAVPPLVTVSDPQVVIESVKLAHDGSGDVVVRLYESLGARASASVGFGLEAASVTVTDVLERPLESAGVKLVDRAVAVELRPFQVLTLRVARG
ncbi:alpha-mannosidase [Bogoriella caseilytica]|uniref:Alpha-mannosidase n=1 Tax=Bogoriella caseilytica TaxID=56055 RepID=A0A3N2BF14_9MICO|nr:glycoside hydrolase family 38 C-terminal domain-containing protein [Bogoriella caseilytica]ROR73851.1 alpha-mannosidase [Bogoriella caseilytica]